MSNLARKRIHSAHSVQFYEDDAFLVDAVARFVGGGLGAGDTVVVIATQAHRDQLADVLQLRGLDLIVARQEGRYCEFDAAGTLAKFMVDGKPDAARFTDVVGGVIARATRIPGSRVLAFGEMVALLWAEGKREAALRLENLWNDLARRLPFSLLCGYPLAAFGSEADESQFLAVCAEHAEVVPAESYTALPSDAERLRAVSRLQQKARALESEILHRRDAEAAREKTVRELTTLATDNARLYDAERRARGEAEAASRAKDEFLAMLGHELRNPLAAVTNAVVTARLDPARRERALDIARRAADQLGRLVDDLLDVARITQGRITLRTQRLPFAGVIERALESTRQLIEERAHAVSTSLPADDLHIDGDSTRLEQVIVNLLSNAAKYTEPGGRITVTAGREGSEAVLRVRDNGIGIAPDMLPRIFDLFAQADRGADRAQGGLGIGLTVVKRLVELHGGRIEARSPGLGEGAEFVLRLSAVGDTQAVVGARSPPVRAVGNRRRVLIVDDNVDGAESLMMLLELLGHRVQIVHDGLAALEAARTNAPDVMLVDIGLPGIDGYEVARRVRQDPALRGVMLVALTGYGGAEDRRRAHAAGFDQHLVKPVDLDALQGVVARLPAASAAALC